MKQIVIILFTLFCLNAAQAQVKGSGIEFGFGVDAGLPVANNLYTYSSIGFGGDATLGYNFDAKYALLVRGGYMTFISKGELRDLGVKSIGDGFLKVVGRYTFSSRFYVEPQVGYSHFSTGGKGLSKIDSDGLTYAAAAGIFLDKTKSFDVSLRYEGCTSKDGIDFVGLRFAYSLKPGSYF